MTFIKNIFRKIHYLFNRPFLHVPGVLCGSYKLIILFIISFPVNAHHVLGRPSYSLGEESTTPPSMQVETHTGDYFVTYMVFPAFPLPNEPGRVNLYVTHKDTGEPYTGEVRFTATSGNFINRHDKLLGIQPPDDNVYRQGYLFSKVGNYTIRTEFNSQGQTYQLDFPLQIGEPAPVGPIGIIIGVILLVLLVVNMVKRKNILIEKIRANRKNNLQQNLADN